MFAHSRHLIPSFSFRTLMRSDFRLISIVNYGYVCQSFKTMSSHRHQYMQSIRPLMTIRDVLHQISIQEIIQQQREDQTNGFDQWESMLETTTVREAITRMVNTNARSLIVTTERNNIIGILTERDILKLNPEDNNLLDKKIKDITTPKIMCSDGSVTALAALATMTGNNLNHLAIVDDKVEAIEEEADLVQKASIPTKAMLSVISVKDILKYYYDKQTSSTTKDVKNQLSNQVIRTNAGVILREKHRKLKLILNTVIEDQISVAEAVKAMTKNNCGSVVILDKDQSVKGIFTERDYITRVMAKDIKPAAALVRDCGTSEPFCVNEGEDLKRCLEAVIKNNFQHFPIIDSNKQICGVLSLKDVGKMVAKEEKAHGFWLMEYFRQKLDAKKSVKKVEETASVPVSTTDTSTAPQATPEETKKGTI